MSINRVNLGAYTENGQSYPGFISVNLEAGAEYVTFHLRESPGDTGGCRPTGAFTVPVEVFEELLKDINGRFARHCNPLIDDERK